MTNLEIENILKNTLGVKKEIVALKPLPEFPENMTRYEGMAAPGLCTQINEVIETGDVFYVTKENHICFEGLIATGVCDVDRQEYREAVESFIDTCPYHRDVDTAMEFYQKCIEAIPLPEVINKCLLVGPLSKITDPDLVLIFCNPKQADILNRCQAYQGNLVTGYGGNGGCIFNIRYSYVTRKPSFSTSDFPWRTFVGLSDDELTVTYPYENLADAVAMISPIVDYVDSLKSMFGE